MRTDFQHLLIHQDGGVLTITMNRPEVLNAFNSALIDELGEAVEAAAQDETVRCVVLTGAGRAFGSGQDLRDLAAVRAGDEPIKVSEHLVSSLVSPVTSPWHAICVSALMTPALSKPLPASALFPMAAVATSCRAWLAWRRPWKCRCWLMK